jgi:hypothetical protein
MVPTVHVVRGWRVAADAGDVLGSHSFSRATENQPVFDNPTVLALPQEEAGDGIRFQPATSSVASGLNPADPVGGHAWLRLLSRPVSRLRRPNSQV